MKIHTFANFRSQMSRAVQVSPLEFTATQHGQSSTILQDIANQSRIQRQGFSDCILCNLKPFYYYTNRNCSESIFPHFNIAYGVVPT